MRARTLLPLLTCTAIGVAATAPLAGAATLTWEGGALVHRAAPGETNFLVLSGAGDGRISISDSGAGTWTYPADCDRLSEEYPVECPAPSAFRAELGDGDDRASGGSGWPTSVPVTIQGADGRDELRAPEDGGATTLDGGAGDDLLRSVEGTDTLHGGPGADTLEGGGGDDVLRGDDGDDLLKPDTSSARPGNDVVDGGAGTDTVDDWVDNGATSRSVNVTFDGAANDGRPGEADNVTGVEVVKAFVAGRWVLSDASEVVESYAAADLGPSVIEARGGDDRVTAGNGEQTIDGGAGSDRIEGGFGADTLTGGPGRDRIVGDQSASQCGVLQSCTVPHGDDVIDARDGERDEVDCGVGNDRATVDAVDVVSNCEAVETAGASAAAGAGTGAGAAPGRTPRLRAPASARLAAAFASGLRVRLTGVRPGAVTVSAFVGRTRVGGGAGRATKDGAATVVVRFTKAGRSTIRRRAAAKVTIVGAGTRTTVTLRRR